MGKNKELTVENAHKILNLVDEFERPGSKGRHDRKHFRGLIVAANDLHAIPRERLIEHFGFSKEMITNAHKGLPIENITPAERKRVILELRKVAEAKLGLRSSPATATESAAESRPAAP